MALTQKRDFRGYGAGSVPAPVGSLLDSFLGFFVSFLTPFLNLFDTGLILEAKATKNKSG